MNQVVLVEGRFGGPVYVYKNEETCDAAMIAMLIGLSALLIFIGIVRVWFLFIKEPHTYIHHPQIHLDQHYVPAPIIGEEVCLTTLKNQLTEELGSVPNTNFTAEGIIKRAKRKKWKKS